MKTLIHSKDRRHPCRRLIALALVASAAFVPSLRAQTTNQYIAATVTPTNIAVAGDQLWLNGEMLIWTNTYGAGLALTNLVSIGGTLTNFVNALALKPYAGTVYSLVWTNTTNVTLVGGLGQAMSLAVTSAWAQITLVTQSVVKGTIPMMPVTILPPATQTNIGSGLVEAVNLATNAFATNATAVQNLLVLGAAPVQTVSGPVQMQALRATNAVLDRPTLTNGQNYGTAFSSLGGGTLSEQFGSGASAAADYSTALGNSAQALGEFSTVIGVASEAGTNAENAIILGGSSSANQANSIVIGTGSSATTNDVVVIGNNSTSAKMNSVIIGNGVTGVSSNEIRLGGSQAVVAAGIFSAPAGITNATLGGSNTLSGELAVSSRSMTSLVDGNNAALNVGTNAVVEMSGATTIAFIAGFGALRDGSEVLIRFSGAVTNWIINETGSSYSTDPTAANRIVTGTGGDLTLTNSPSFLRIRYRSASSRWEVLHHSR